MNFGALTVVWVVPLLERKLTPRPRFQILNDVKKFGVEQKTEEFLPLNPQFVSLPFQLSKSRLDYGQFRLEPAIAALDWLFTPNPRL
jgi:hypothetical protein